jgi:hypothetical protein
MLLIMTYNMYYNECFVHAIVDGGSVQHMSPWTDSGRWPAVASGEKRVGEQVDELVPPKAMFLRQESDFSSASLQRQHQEGNAFTGQRSSGLC